MVEITQNPVPGESDRQVTITHNPLDMDRLRRSCEENWKNDHSLRESFASYEEYFKYSKWAAEQYQSNSTIYGRGRG